MRVTAPDGLSAGWLADDRGSDGWTPAENGGADADEGRAFFDGNFVIVAHTHRQFGQHGLADASRRHPIADAVELPEPAAGTLQILRRRRNDHEACQMDGAAS